MWSKFELISQTYRISMGKLYTPAQKHFKSASVYVSVLPAMAPDQNMNLTDEQKEEDLRFRKTGPPSILLTEFLSSTFVPDRKIIRAREMVIALKRHLYVLKNVPSAVIPCQVWTRDFSRPVKDIIKKYNGLAALEFPLRQGRERIMDALKAKEWVLYAGASVLCDNIVAIVPLDNTDYKEHYRYMSALKKEFMKDGLDFTSDGDQLLYRFIKTYDPDAWLNEDCILFQIKSRRGQTLLEE